ncbi:MAG: TRAP transporter substrate-binding protein DctP [Tropicimonas sp.]|uniref:TRAP transporter substrate-binding protein DctP n=1 Tax=Tropicimonas sp. TaxID=2067044 RepID=UPI003A877AA5
MNFRIDKSLIAICVFAMSTTVADAEPVTFRISSENNANHVNTRFLRDFADRVNAAAGDKIHVELFDSGQLYKGRDVPRALRQGSVEMAAVGTWQLGAVAPNVDLLFIPSFYGRKTDVLNALVDGELGDTLDAEIGGKLNSVVLGRWIGFGEALTFGAGRPVSGFDDLKGMKVRIPGGLANTARYKALGAVPTVVPWPDTQLALQQGAVDGLLTTYETAASAKLWESGVTTAFEDNQYFGYFVPIVSNAFWNKADPEVRDVLQTTWESMVDEGRTAAAQSQGAARQTLIENGVQITVPDPAELDSIRTEMIAGEDALVDDLGADPKLYEQIKAALDASRQ